MPYFAYTARSPGGELLEGVLESADVSAAASHLLAKGVTPVDIAPGQAPDKTESFAYSGIRKDRIRSVDIMLFSRQMYTLMKAGVPIMRALAGLQESSTNARLAQVLAGVRERLDAGNDLAASLAAEPKIFDNFYVAMVRVGEMTGRLEEIFLALFKHVEFEQFMRDQVKAAIRYPTFVVAVMGIALVIINLFVIPAFAKVYAGLHAELPLITQMIIGFSDFMVAAWPYLLGGSILGVYMLRQWIATEAGRLKWDMMKIKLPIAGRIVLQATLARFARSLALALRSGVPVAQALQTVSKTVDNEYIGQSIVRMRDGLERGESVLRTAAQTGVFTPVVLQMIAVGEESGALDDLLQEIAEMYQRETEYSLKMLSSQIEPILIVCLAIMVLILALGVFLPIWNLGSAILHGS